MPLLHPCDDPVKEDAIVAYKHKVSAQTCPWLYRNLIFDKAVRSKH